MNFMLSSARNKNSGAVIFYILAHPFGFSTPTQFVSVYIAGFNESILWYEQQDWVSKLWKKSACGGKEASLCLILSEVVFGLSFFSENTVQTCHHVKINANLCL